MDLLKQLGHGQPGLVVGISLESVEDFASHDLFTGARDQPVVEKDRGSRIPKPANADFRFPETGLEFLPVVLVRVLDVRAGFKQSLEDEVLDQVGRRELRPTSVQRLEDLLSILVGGEVDHDHLQEVTYHRLDRRRPALELLPGHRARAIRVLAR